MSLINLEKTARIVLEKHNLIHAQARVGAAFDVSGSTKYYYQTSKNGDESLMQRTIDRVLALACQFDDNRELDTWLFHHQSRKIDNIKETSLNGYIKRLLKSESGFLWGGTSFYPLIRDILTEFYPNSDMSVKLKKGLRSLFSSFFSPSETTAPSSAEELSEFPTYIIIFTDGNNDDHDETLRIIDRSSDKDIYWQFIGVGEEKFEFLTSLSKKFSHVDFIKVQDFEKTSDEDLYQKMINVKFVKWMKKQPSLLKGVKV